MALEMQNFESLSPPVVKKITWWTLLYRLGYPAVIAQLAKCVGPEEFCPTQIIAGSNSMLPQCFVALVRDIF